jgi:hypothetical protein
LKANGPSTKQYKLVELSNEAKIRIKRDKINIKVKEKRNEKEKHHLQAVDAGSDVIPPCKLRACSN